MSRTLRILHLEDQADDAELVQDCLEREGFDCRITLVSNRAGFIVALDDPELEVILSDFELRGFDGLEALKLATERVPQTPFILVSGTIGEAAAIESLRNGATDYVLKHRLNRLAPAVTRALQEAEERRNRRAAVDALRYERHFLRAVLESVQTGLIACDADGAMTVFNRSAKEIYGLPSQSPHALLAPRVKVLREDGMTPVAPADMPLERVLRGESVQDEDFVMIPPGASARRVIATGRAVIDEDGRRLGAVVAMQDVSDQRRLTEQLRQSQKMDAIGRLAGGVAHDFNNLLTVILGYGTMLARLPELDDDALQAVREIQAAATRAAGLTRQLLAFSRQQVLAPRVLDLNEVIMNMDRLLRRVIGEDIDLTTSPSADLGRVKADQGQIEQVVLNLVVNARDAMPHGGKLTIETANFEDGSIMLAVSDSGCGMDAGTKSRIFDPFFTTKPVGAGTGLGLSTVHGIVEQSAGHIEVYSELGQGSTFKIFLPRVDAALKRESHEADAIADLHGRETILVAEDDEMVRKILVVGLRDHGYTVLEASNRTEALKQCRSQADARAPLDLLVCDLVMPGIGVAEMMDQLLACQPEVEILFISGYTGRAMVHQGVLDGRANFIQKPFTIDVLLSRIRLVLDGPQSAAA